MQLATPRELCLFVRRQLPLFGLLLRLCLKHGLSSGKQRFPPFISTKEKGTTSKNTQSSMQASVSDGAREPDHCSIRMFESCSGLPHAGVQRPCEWCAVNVSDERILQPVLSKNAEILGQINTHWDRVGPTNLFPGSSI